MRWAMTRRSAGLRVEGVIVALREAQHALLPHIGGHVAGEGDGGVLAGHDDERGLGRMGEAGRHEEGPRRGGHTQGGVLAGIELSPERIQTAGFLQREGERIDEHSGLFSSRANGKSRPSGRVGARDERLAQCSALGRAATRTGGQ